VRRYLRQGTLDFSVGYKLQTRWGAAEAGVFTLECAGAGLIAASLLCGDYARGLGTGVALVAGAILLLLSHLGHPARAWRAMLNVRTSWISRGTLALGALFTLGACHAALLVAAPYAYHGMPGELLAWVLLGLAAFVSCYPGLVLSSSPAIPFWNSGLLAVLSAVSGLASGLAALLALLALDGRYSGLLVPLAGIEGWLLVALAAILAIYVASMARRGAAAAESASFLLRGQPGLFVMGACVTGIAAPLLVALALGAGDETPAVVVVLAAAARLGGDFALRHAFLKVGMFNPVV
jgi:formate-dependent nitrite reductase membrane component NrfD